MTLPSSGNQLQLLVAGVDRSACLEQEGWTIVQQWSRQGDTATFTLRDERSVRTTLSFVINPLDTVVLYDVTLGQTLFSGLVPEPKIKILGPLLTQWDLNCVDWTYLSDRALVVGDWSTMTADALAVQITTLADCGITAATVAAGGQVAPGALIPRIQLNYCTLTEAWTKLSRLASMSSTYGWYVDENHALHLHDETQAPSSGLTFTDDVTTMPTDVFVVDGDAAVVTLGYPSSVTTDGDVLVVPDTIRGLSLDSDVLVQAGRSTYVMYAADSFSYEWDGTSIRNVVTVRGATFSQDRTDRWVGNGQQASFPLTFVPDANAIANLVNSAGAVLTVAGVRRTVTAATSGSAADTDWVIVGNAANQWFLITNTDPAPADGDLIEFTYPFAQPIVSQTSDPTSIARFASLPNRGRFAYHIADSSLASLLSAQQRGQREVSTYGQPAERAEVELSEDFLGHFRAGQTVTLVNGAVPDSVTGNVGINGTFLVVQLRIAGKAGWWRTYTATLTRIAQ